MEYILIECRKSKIKAITITNQYIGTYHKEPFRTERKSKQTASSAGKRELSYKLQCYTRISSPASLYDSHYEVLSRNIFGLWLLKHVSLSMTVTFKLSQKGKKTIMRTRHKLFVSFCRIKAGATEPRPLEQLIVTKDSLYHAYSRIQKKKKNARHQGISVFHFR